MAWAFSINQQAVKLRLNMRKTSIATGICYPSIRRMWHGKLKKVDVDHINILCEILQCDPKDLFIREERTPDYGEDGVVKLKGGDERE